MHFRHAKEKRDEKRLRYRGWKTAASVAVFLSTVCLVPLYNKSVFDGVGEDQGFPYPLMVTFLQLAFCAIVLTVWSIAAHFIHQNGRDKRIGIKNSNSNSSLVASHARVVADPPTTTLVEAPLVVGAEAVDVVEVEDQVEDDEESGEDDDNVMGFQPLVCGPQRSWICGPHLAFKIRHTALIGVFFGLKFGITNWGLKLLPLPTHLLLQSTDLMWTVLFAHLFNKEVLTIREGLCCLLSLGGSVLVALRAHALSSSASAFPVVVNLCSPILLGLCVSTLRLATERLLVQESKDGVRFRDMDAFELTAIKLWISSLVVLPASLLLEGEFISTFADARSSRSSVPVLTAMFGQTNPALLVLATLGGLLIVVFQTNITYLSQHTSTVTLGIVGGLKVLPQWTVALLVKRQLDVSVLNISGAVLLLCSSLAWTAIKVSALRDAVSPSSTDLHDNEFLLPSHHSKRRLAHRRGTNSRVLRAAAGPGAGNNDIRAESSTLLQSQQNLSLSQRGPMYGTT